MTWIDSVLNVPADGAEILVRRNDKFNLAIYDAGRKRFIIRDGSVVKVGSEMVEWAELVHPVVFEADRARCLV